MRSPTLRFLFALLLLAAGLLAQEAPPPVTAPQAPVRTVTKERSVYIPFADLEKVFEKQERGVFLPYREFLEMWNKLNLPESLRPPPPPVEGVLSAAGYEGKVDKDVATLKATLSFEALKEGWSKLSLGAAGLAITEAKSKALLAPAKEGYDILFPDKGPYTLEATLFGKITHEAGRSTLTLPLPKTAVSQFALTLPEKGLEFTIEPAAAFSAQENPDGSTRLLVYFGAAETVTISWTRRAAETALQPLLFADVSTEVRITPGAVRTESEVTYSILRAGVEALELQVPKDQQVLSVEGENLREWTVADAKEPGQQTIHVALYTPARDAYTLSVKLERALGALPQPVPFPLLRVLGAERQAGTVSLYSDPELTTEVSDLQDLTQQAVSGEAEGLRAQGEYRYLHAPYAGKISVAQAKPQVEVNSQTLVVVEADRVSLRAAFDCTVKRAGIFSLAIGLPPGLAHVEATGDGVESSTVATEGGKETLQVKFTGRRTGQFSFQLTADAPRAKPESPLIVPVFQPQAERHEARVGVAIHTSLKANTTERGDLREEDVRGLISLPIAKPENTPLTLGFRYRGTARPAQLQFEARKPRVSAEVGTLLEVREALLRHTWFIGYHVEYAGIDELQVAVPAEIADDVQIEGADIKERAKLPAEKGAATVTWRVALQAKVLGDYTLRLSWETPRGEQKPGQTVPVALKEVRVLNVSRETGQVAVVKDGNIEIVKNDPKGLELIDPKELGPNLQTEGIFLAWKYAAHPIALQLAVSKNLFLEVPMAIVNYAVLGSVIAEDEAETTEAIYWIKNNGQQFFSVGLPPGAKLLSDAFVDGEPQQPSRRPDRNELLIRLPASRENHRAFSIRFVYERPSTHPGRRLGWRGALKLEPPQIAGVRTLQSRWTLHLPTEYRYVEFAGPMHEAGTQRHWDALRLALEPFVPQFGPIAPGPDSAEQTEPPDAPAARSAGFDTQLQIEGVSVVLRRLGEPAPVGVAFRGKAWAATVEALAFLLVLAGGLWLLGGSRQGRFAYFVIFGLGALIVAGARDPRAVGLWQSIYLGALAALVVWLIVWALRKLRRFRLPRWPHPRPQPPAPAVPPPIPPAAPAN